MVTWEVCLLMCFWSCKKQGEVIRPKMELLLVWILKLWTEHRLPSQKDLDWILPMTLTSCVIIFQAQLTAYETGLVRHSSQGSNKNDIKQFQWILINKYVLRTTMRQAQVLTHSRQQWATPAHRDDPCSAPQHQHDNTRDWSLPVREMLCF